MMAILEAPLEETESNPGECKPISENWEEAMMIGATEN
jgi:hypothetical protein